MSTWDLTDSVKRNIVVGVMLAMFLASLDSTIVSPALPTIGASLGGANFLSWVVSAYFLTSTAVTPLYGKLSDIHGRRPIVLLALIIFLVGSVACALSPNMAVLILARAVQGLGGGGLLTSAQTVVADIAPPRERARYVVYISSVWAASSILGPAVGGFCAEHLSWTVIFWLNLPIGALAFIMCWRLLRLLPHHRRPHRLDVLGSVLVIGASVCLMLMLTLGGATLAWNSPTIIALFGASVVLGAAFILHLLRAPEPLIPLTVFRNKVVSAATASMFFGMLNYIGATVYLPIYFESVLGVDPTTSGVAIVVLLATSVTSSFIAGRNAPRVRHYKHMGYAGLSLAMIALTGLAYMLPRLNFLGAEIWIGLYGFGVGFLFPLCTVSVQNAVDPRDMGVATATLAFLRALGSALGVAALGAIVLAYGVGEGARVDPAQSVAAFRVAFAAMALASLASLLAFAIMEEKPLRGRAVAATEPEIA